MKSEQSNQTILKIGGMHCAMCVRTVENVLKGVNGVTNVTVNLATEKAYVEYTDKFMLENARRAIESAGYQLLGKEGELSGDKEDQALALELKNRRRRFIIGFVVGAVLMFLMYLPSMKLVGWHYLQFMIATPFFFYLSLPIFRAAWQALRNRSLNMDVMYALGIGTAYLASVMGTFNLFLTPEYSFYETAVFLATFLTLGRYLEARAKGKTTASIKQLMKLQPQTAIVTRNGVGQEIPLNEVQVGDLVTTKPGGKIAVDGEVVAGTSFVNESMLTGESVPVYKQPGDKVFGGTLNRHGALQYRATRVGQETMLAQIIRLVEQAQSSKPPVQRLADLVVSYFIPVVLLIAIGAFIIWYVIVGQSLLFALTTLIAVLVIACPCALGLATPTAVTVGLGRGAELGILIKNGEVLEIAPQIDMVIFDKTGTLTEGQPRVTAVFSLQNNENRLLQLAASVEQQSEHPLGEAIVEYARRNGIELLPATAFAALEGQGVEATIADQPMLVGSPQLMQQRQIELPPNLQTRLDEFQAKGASVIIVSMAQAALGLIALADELKDSAIPAVRQLQRERLEVVMLTGDNQQTARAIAHKLQVDNYLAEIMPQDKAATIKKLQEQGKKVAFVGDGINDAPALAQADIGIAIGSGTDVAVETGDIVLVKNDLTDVVAALELSRKVMSRIRQNLFWALAYNSALIPVAAGALYPLFGITFKPELGGLAMALSSVTVISLSLLLKKYLPPSKRLLNSKGGK